MKSWPSVKIVAVVVFFPSRIPWVENIPTRTETVSCAGKKKAPVFRDSRRHQEGSYMPSVFLFGREGKLNLTIDEKHPQFLRSV